MNTPISGFFYLLDGFSLITKPGLKRYVIIPTLINIVLFIGLFFLAGYYLSEFNAWFENLVPTWLQWLAIVFWILFIVSFFLFFIYTFVIVANLIASPFNSLLSEKVALYLTGTLPPDKGLWENIKDIPHILGRQLSIIGYYLPRVALLFLLFFVPFVQGVAPVLWFLFNAWFMTITYVDYPTDNHRVSLSQMRAWLNDRRGLSFGFGISVLIATMIPFVNLITIPAAVAGATKLWLFESKK